MTWHYVRALCQLIRCSSHRSLPATASSCFQLRNLSLQRINFNIGSCQILRQRSFTSIEGFALFLIGFFHHLLGLFMPLLLFWVFSHELIHCSLVAVLQLLLLLFLFIFQLLHLLAIVVNVLEPSFLILFLQPLMLIRKFSYFPLQIVNLSLSSVCFDLLLLLLLRHDLIVLFDGLFDLFLAGNALSFLLLLEHIWLFC